MPGCPVFFKPGEIAARLGVRLETVYKWMTSGQLGYRLWYRGKLQRTIRIVDSDALAVFIDSYFPKYEAGSNSIHVKMYDQYLASRRKGQQAALAVKLAKKAAQMGKAA